MACNKLCSKKYKSKHYNSGGIEDKQNKTFIKNYSKRVPMKRMGKINELNGILAYLIGGKSSYVTGQEFIIDGGLSSW